MCNLYSVTKGQQAIREAFHVMTDRTGNLPSTSGVFPDYAVPIVRNGPDGRVLTTARWGMPSPNFALQGRRTECDQHPQREVAALASMARAGEPLLGAVYQL